MRTCINVHRLYFVAMWFSKLPFVFAAVDPINTGMIITLHLVTFLLIVM